MNDTEMIECREPALQMQRLIAIMKRLRAPHGCPWDAEQTHHSLISNMIEEAYEVVDTIPMYLPSPRRTRRMPY